MSLECQCHYLYDDCMLHDSMYGTELNGEHKYGYHW